MVCRVQNVIVFDIFVVSSLPFLCPKKPVFGQLVYFCPENLLSHFATARQANDDGDEQQNPQSEPKVHELIPGDIEKERGRNGQIVNGISTVNSSNIRRAQTVERPDFVDTRSPILAGVGFALIEIILAKLSSK